MVLAVSAMCLSTALLLTAVLLDAPLVSGRRVYNRYRPAGGTITNRRQFSTATTSNNDQRRHLRTTTSNNNNYRRRLSGGTATTTTTNNNNNRRAVVRRLGRPSNKPASLGSYGSTLAGRTRPTTVLLSNRPRGSNRVYVVRAGSEWPSATGLNVTRVSSDNRPIVISPSARVRVPVNSVHTNTKTSGSHGNNDWGYDGHNGPAMWPIMYPACAGSRQSPINIQTSGLTSANVKIMTSIRMVSVTNKFSVSYDGASVTLTPKGRVYMTGLDNPGETHVLTNVHFHWSSLTDVGSEHAINGVRFPVEMHMVCYASKYSSKDEASTKKDGYAVVAVIFDIGRANAALWPILTAARAMRREGEVVQVSGDLMELMPARTDHFFRYHGSLTTPPCTENVLWTVMEHVQTLTAKQLQMLQDLRRGSLVTRSVVIDNVRPLQQTNNRPIFTNNFIFARG